MRVIDTITEDNGEPVYKMTMKQAEDEMKSLKKVFTVVRLLRPDDFHDPDFDMENKELCQCYSFWQEDHPCENCISMKAFLEKKDRTKLEFINSDIYHVIARYLEIDGKPYIMELIKRLDEDFLMCFSGREKLFSKLSLYHDELYKDVLTGAYNRRYFEEKIKKSQISAGVVMIDLDDFKLYNDTCGHDAGDVVLDTVVRVIRECIRKTDTLIRYGGDEFLLIMPDINQENLTLKLRQIRRAINHVDVPGYSRIRLSVSMGGVMSDGKPLEEAVSKADKLMYQAKNKKNTVVTEATKKDIESEKNRQEILIVDDSEMNRAILSEMLGGEYKIHEASNGEECLAVLNQYGTAISLVLLDIIMPAMDGFQVLRAMSDNHWIEDIPVIMISSEDSELTVRRAYELGVSDYISRPFDAKVIYQRVFNTIKLYAKQRRLVTLLTDQIYQKERNNRMMIGILSQIVEFRNGESGSHVIHINSLTQLLIERLSQKTDKYRDELLNSQLIVTASVLHDIGKIGIDEQILNKPGKLTAEEFAHIKQHTVIGESILKKLELYENEPLIEVARQICRWHHERYDGKGYPDGLTGDNIPICAQVVSVADVYDALVNKRVYKDAYSHEKAVEMIFNGECGVFNPLLLECLTDIKDKIKEEYSQKQGGEAAVPLY